MDQIKKGTDVWIEFESWVNKSLPRYQISISGDREHEVWPTLYAPGASVKSMLAHFFPWANFSVDEEAHRIGAEADWTAECYLGRDSDTGEPYFTEEFEDWYTRPKGLVPVANNGETETYRLILSLNSFGQHFMEIDDYLSDPDFIRPIGFTLER